MDMYLIYKDNYGRLHMIGRERTNRALIGCDSQWNPTRWRALPSPDNNGGIVQLHDWFNKIEDE